MSLYEPVDKVKHF